MDNSEHKNTSITSVEEFKKLKALEGENLWKRQRLAHSDRDVFYDPSTNMYYKHFEATDFPKEDLAYFRQAYDNEILAYKYASVLNFNVPEIIYSFEDTRPDGNSENFDADHVILMSSAGSSSLENYIYSSTTTLFEKENIIELAKYEILRRMVTFGDGDPNTRNILVNKNAKDGSFSLAHIDFEESVMNSRSGLSNQDLKRLDRHGDIGCGLYNGYGLNPKTMMQMLESQHEIVKAAKGNMDDQHHKNTMKRVEASIKFVSKKL